MAIRKGQREWKRGIVCLDACSSRGRKPSRRSCARGGKRRVHTRAADHDVQPAAPVTPVGMFLPASDELLLSGVTFNVTSDGLVDCLIEWWETVRERFPLFKTQPITVDHGPENHRRRTPCMQRFLACIERSQITVRPASHPPYHSTDHPIERCWGIGEHHRHGAFLDSVHAMIQDASTMTWKGTHPVVAVMTSISHTGVTLTTKAMDVVDAHLQHVPSLGYRVSRARSFGMIQYSRFAQIWTQEQDSEKRVA